MVVNVAREAWHEAYEGILPAEVIDRTLDEWYDEETIRAEIDGEDPFYVGADASEIVAFAHGGVDGEGRAILHRIYARRVFWYSGIGSWLLAAVAANLWDAGHEELRAVVLADNRVGRKFYEARGFEEVERRSARFGETTAEEFVLAAPLESLFDRERGYVDRVRPEHEGSKRKSYP